MTEKWEPPIGWSGPLPVLYQHFDTQNGFTLNSESQLQSIGDILISDKVHLLINTNECFKNESG